MRQHYKPIQGQEMDDLGLTPNQTGQLDLLLPTMTQKKTLMSLDWPTTTVT